MGLLPHERYVFSCATITMGIAGVGIVILNTFAKAQPDLHKLNLTKALWKFQPQDSKVVMFRQKRIAWYKLLLAGVMMAALVLTLAIRFAPVLPALATSVTLFAFWIVYLWYYWKSYVITDADDPETAPVASTPPAPESEAAKAWQQRKRDTAAESDTRLPVTIITGFLGSGKTTLVKEILNNTVGMKVLVIENEIGSEGIDHDLLMQHTAKEDIILMNNGCICCNVRGDLLSTFRQMFTNEAFALLDWIVIETTGLADPAPLIQSFYMDSECQRRLKLDAVLTVVDCKHLPTHLAQYKYDQLAQATFKDHVSQKTGGSGAHGGIPEAVLQLSFADIVLANKTDLVTKKDLQKLLESIAEINPSAVVETCQFGKVDIVKLLNLGAFDPVRFAKQMSSQPVTANRPILIERDAKGKIIAQARRVNLTQQNDKAMSSVQTISLVVEEAVDLNKFNAWMASILQSQGPQLFRLKGILFMDGYGDTPFVCHAVHMVFDGQRGKPSAGQSGQDSTVRKSRLVVIGRDLDLSIWESGFKDTLVSSTRAKDD